MTRRKNNILVITVCILVVCFIIFMNYGDLSFGVIWFPVFIITLLLGIIGRNKKAKKITIQ